MKELKELEERHLCIQCSKSSWEDVERIFCNSLWYFDEALEVSTLTTSHCVGKF